MPTEIYDLHHTLLIQPGFESYAMHIETSAYVYGYGKPKNYDFNCILLIQVSSQNYTQQKKHNDCSCL